MKSTILKKIRSEFGLRKIQGKKLELHSFYNLCAFYKMLKRGDDIK